MNNTRTDRQHHYDIRRPSRIATRRAATPSAGSSKPQADAAVKAAVLAADTHSRARIWIAQTLGVSRRGL